MKHYLLIQLLLPFSFLSAESNLAYKEMLTVNACWKDNPDGIQLLQSSERIHKNAIIQHLFIVEKTLRNRSTEHLSSTQKINRLKNLDVLYKYASIGIVPTNDYVKYTTPVFIDRKGVHCAVGYLIKESRFQNLAKAINSKQKFAYIKNIKNEELLQWQKESGLSLDELAWIQPGYPYFGHAANIGKGLNGEIKDLAESSGKYSLIAAGSFMIPGIQDSILVAGFDGQFWKAILTGKGIVNKMEVNGNIITSYGGNITYPGVASAEIIETNISGSSPVHTVKAYLDGEIYGFETYQSKKFICGSFTGGLAYKGDSSWVSIPSFYYKAPKSIKSYNGNLYIAGDSFDENIGYRLSRYNGSSLELIYKSNYPRLNKSLSSLNVYHNKLYIGLKSEWWSDTLLYIFDGNTLNLPVLNTILSGKELKNIIVKDSALLLVGDLYCGNFIGGNGVIHYKSEYIYDYHLLISIQGYTNTAILKNDNEYYIGGSFNTYHKKGQNGFQYQDTLNNIGIVYKNLVSIPIIPNSSETISIYPNPSNGLFTMNNYSKSDVTIKVYTLQGLEITSCFDEEKGTIDLTEFASGIYQILVYRNNQIQCLKIIKE